MKKLFYTLTFLVGFLTIISSCKKDKDIGKKINVNLNEFSQISERFPYSNLTTDRPVDYWELIYSQGSGYDKIVSSSGVKCQNSTNQTDCVLRFDSTKSLNEGFGHGCQPGDCFYYIKYQSADQISLITDKAALKSFIGDVNTPGDAILLAISEGYYFSTGNKEIGAIKETSTGYEILMTKTVSYCTPVQINRFHLEVTRNGTINILGEEKYSYDKKACV